MWMAQMVNLQHLQNLKGNFEFVQGGILAAKAARDAKQEARRRENTARMITFQKAVDTAQWKNVAMRTANAGMSYSTLLRNSIVGNLKGHPFQTLWIKERLTITIHDLRSIRT